MKLNFYIVRKYLFAFVSVFAAFGLLLILLDLVEELHRAANSPITFMQAVGLAVLNMPSGLYRILPLITILATVILFLGLARTSELVVIRAAGRSALRILFPVVLSAFAIGIFSVAVFNPIVAATSQAYDAMQDHFSNGDQGSSTMSIGHDGLWLRQGGPEGQTVIRAARSSLDGTELRDATFIRFNAEGQPLLRIAAGSAELTPGAWTLSNVKIWNLTEKNPEVSAKEAKTLSLPSNLTRNQIRDSFGSPSDIPIWQLPTFIAQLTKAGFSAREHRVWFQMELATPILLVAMVLIGAGFTMRHARFGKTGLMVLFALIAGFSIFFLRNFAQVLGVNGQIPIALAAWGPPVAGVLLPLSLLLHLEDG